MEGPHIQAETSNVWGDAKRARTEETSTVYRPPTCDDLPLTPPQQPARLPNKQKLDFIVEEEEGLSSPPKSKPPAAASSLSKLPSYKNRPVPDLISPREARRPFRTARNPGARMRPEPDRVRSADNNADSNYPLPLHEQAYGMFQDPEPTYNFPHHEPHGLRQGPFGYAYPVYESAANAFSSASHPYLSSSQRREPPMPTMKCQDHDFQHRHHNFYSRPAQRNEHSQEQPAWLAQAPQVALQPASPVIASSEATPKKDIDPVELVEDYLESLRSSKEKELLEANRILSWIDQRSSRKKPKKYSDALDFQVADSESLDNDRAVPTVVSFARTTERAQSMYEAPTPTINHTRQSDEEKMTERLTGDSGDVSTGSLYSDNTIRPYVPSRYTSSIEPPKPIIHDPIYSDIDKIPANNQSILDTSDNDGDNSLLEEINSLRRDNASLRQQLHLQDLKDEKRFGFNIFLAYARWKKSFQNRPALGKRRCYWTCECGEGMFTDLRLTNNSDCQRMLEFLNRSSDSRDQDQTTPSQLEEGIAQMNYITPNQSQSSLGNGKAPVSTVSSDTTWVGSSGSQSAQLEPNRPYTKAKYLELCVNIGKYKTKLVEIQVTASNASGLTICTDGHLFRKIYTRYFELRKVSWRRFLYRPAGIKFVHFGVQQNEEVIFFKDDQYPTEEVLAKKLYEYDLQPPIPPPMDSRTFLHYFYEHNAHSQLRSAKFVHRLPKKLGESLVRSIGPEELREGWGVHIMEGPNKVAICWILMAVLVASLGVSLGYDLITKSGDSGFAIGQWMVAALTVALSALYFSLEDEVNSNFD